MQLILLMRIMFLNEYSDWYESTQGHNEDYGPTVNNCFYLPPRCEPPRLLPELERAVVVPVEEREVVPAEERLEEVVVVVVVVVERVVVAAGRPEVLTLEVVPAERPRTEPVLLLF